MENNFKNDIDPEIHDYEKFKPPIQPKSPVESFKYAVDGILDVFRTQKHMRFHFVTMALVLLVAMLSSLSKRDILVIMFVISLVLTAEMFNTAIEAVVDMITQTYHPLAKFAKDAAAGGVLIATMTAILVGIMLAVGSDSGIGAFSGIHRDEDPDIFMRIILTGVIVLVVVTIAKVLGTRGKLLKGGVVSGHSAAGFFLAVTILFVTRNGIAAILAIMLAMLVAQSRVEAKIHSIQEVVNGALVALLLTATVYWFPNVSKLLSMIIPIHIGRP